MMTSTYPGSRSNNNLNHGLKEIQSKKEALISLETALKKRVNEFKELCLKEGELTGHLPVDYPLQPREPIPQIRRRHNQLNSGSTSASSSNNNLNETNSIIPPSSSSIRAQQFKIESTQPQTTFAIPSNSLTSASINFPSRPTSTNSTSSSISTASSNTRSAHNAIINSHPSSSSLTRNSTAQIMNNNNGFTPNQPSYTDQSHNMLDHRNQRSTRYDQTMMPNHFKRPFNLGPTPTFDCETLGHMRASSTASSSSSSGSGTSSVLSAPPNLPNPRTTNGSNINYHTRSYSESISNNPSTLGSNTHLHPKSLDMVQRQHLFSSQSSSQPDLPAPPARPPRGPHQMNRQLGSNTVDSDPLKPPSENRTRTLNTHQLQKEVANCRALQHFNMNGLANFQPFVEEETKPFQMSDFYKYSSKYRQKDPQKTTRQLQEEISKKSSFKFSTCDDHIQGLPKLFEKSGQKLIEATAKAIAGNPGLAEKLNNILPNNKSDRFPPPVKSCSYYADFWLPFQISSKLIVEQLASDRIEHKVYQSYCLLLE